MLFTIVVKLVLAIIMYSFVMGLAALLTWMERKESAVMQDRIGANRADVLGFRAWGLFHIIADSVKMMLKEDFIPPFSNKLIHNLAPLISVLFALLAFACIPFGGTLKIYGKEITLQIANLNIALLFIFATLSLGIYGVILGGWSSFNKWAIISSQRAVAQLLSFGFALAAIFISIVMVYDTFNLQVISQKQGELLFGFIPKWGIFLQPLGFILFLIVGIAETKRIPFDLPEGESEVIGYFVEYSGLKFGMFFLTDFVETILISALTVVFYLGSYQIPYLGATGFVFPGGFQIALPHIVVVLLQVIAFGIKVFIGCWFLLLVRWTLPRFRYDQMMKLGWEQVVPLSIINIFITAIIILYAKGALNL
jgi:NADH-quinone oxidoreductase subunit H